MSPHCNRLYLFLDGELGAVDEENFRHHLARCEPCASGLHEAMQLELLGLQVLGGGGAVALKAVEAPVDLAPERAWRVRPPRGRWPVALAMAAGLAALGVFAPSLAPSLREAPQEVWLAQASTRQLESRVAYGRAAGHRPYTPMRSGRATPSAMLPLRVLADLEDAGDLHGIAAAYLVRKDLRQAWEFLRRAEPSPDRDCDLAIISLEQGHYEEALALLEGTLRQVPGHPQALWNQALVLRELGLTSQAAEAFEAVARQGEPGWSDEARLRARALRQQTQAPGYGQPPGLSGAPRPAQALPEEAHPR